jgi:hypothetical protein
LDGGCANEESEFIWDRGEHQTTGQEAGALRILLEGLLGESAGDIAPERLPKPESNAKTNPKERENLKAIKYCATCSSDVSQ